MRERFGAGSGRAVARYSVNAGPLDADSWYRNEELEGSRFIGEGGHFIDTVGWWLGANPIEVYAAAAGDAQETQVVMRYEDGSVATIGYVTNGNPRFPKEIFEVSANGRTARLDNFKQRDRVDGSKPDNAPKPPERRQGPGPERWAASSTPWRPVDRCRSRCPRSSRPPRPLSPSRRSLALGGPQKL